MNAKQLIKAAKEVLSSHDPACSHIWNAHRTCQWCHRDRRDVYVDDIARHILATVRPDDDEPVTREMVDKLKARVAELEGLGPLIVEYADCKSISQEMTECGDYEKADEYRDRERKAKAKIDAILKGGAP